MCGLAGYFYFDQRKDEELNIINEMITLQKHRGPDDSALLGINTKDSRVLHTVHSNAFERASNLVFGFNRLSILDLSISGRQPMISDDGKVALMMNGEVYNAFDYSDDLEKRGYSFKSTTDTEVVLNLYMEFGIEGMLQRLNGMYAIAIWDQRIRKLFLARDRFGIKPLYILREAGRLSFSSEMKSFGALPGFSFELDQDKLDEFLLFRNVINETLFKNIINCTPGTFLSVNDSGDIREHSYYKVDNEGTEPIPAVKAYNSLEDSLRRSVHRQMISDVKLGCQLSGGVDSSLVSCYAKESLEEGALETISITFDNPRYSEETYIDEVAEKLTLYAHKYTMDPDYYFDQLKNASWHFEQPLNHPNTIGIYLLSEKAKEHVTVLLSGEGADEALAGYDRFLDSVGSPYFSRRFLSKLKQHSSSLLSFIKYYKNDDSRLIMESSFGTPLTAQMLYQDFNFMSALQKRRDILKNIDGEPLLRSRKYEIITYLPDLLMRQDKMSMAHSIENRVPFLDNEMVTTSLNIPGEELVNNWNGKKEAKLLLKRLCGQKFGDRFAFRRKKGFGIPLKDFMSSKNFTHMWDSEIEPGINTRGIFETNKISKWMLEIDKATPAQLDAIWLMTGFELWAKTYLD